MIRACRALNKVAAVVRVGRDRVGKNGVSARLPAADRGQEAIGASANPATANRAVFPAFSTSFPAYFDFPLQVDRSWWNISCIEEPPSGGI